MKIYEAMAARIPVVSTAIGAEGLAVRSPENIRLAEKPEELAADCLALLGDESQRERVADAAWALVKTAFSWDEVTRQFERALDG